MLLNDWLAAGRKGTKVSVPMIDLGSFVKEAARGYSSTVGKAGTLLLDGCIG